MELYNLNSNWATNSNWSLSINVPASSIFNWMWWSNQIFMIKFTLKTCRFCCWTICIRSCCCHFQFHFKFTQIYIHLHLLTCFLFPSFVVFWATINLSIENIVANTLVTLHTFRNITEHRSMSLFIDATGILLMKYINLNAKNELNRECNLMRKCTKKIMFKI